jgi:acyl carrier protein
MRSRTSAPHTAARNAPPPLPQGGGITPTEEHQMHQGTSPEQAEQVQARVYEAIAGFDVDAALITREASLEDLSIDSLDLVELTQLLEDEYEIRIGADDAQQFDTVGDIISLVLARLS